MKKIASLFYFVLALNFAVEGQKKAFEGNLSYASDLATSFSGNASKNIRYMGLLEGRISLDTESAKWWKGGLFNLNLINTHGKGITSTVFNDFQGVSSVEAGNHPLLVWELSYQHRINRFTIKGGIVNLNSDYMIQHYASDFSCGSFGFFPTLAVNYSAANYPVSGLGFSGSYQINNNLNLISSIYNGEATLLKENQLNIHNNIDFRDDGLLSISELKYTSDSTKYLASCYALGIVLHSDNFAAISKPNVNYKGNYTFYAFGEHDIYKTKNKKNGIFAQASFAPKDRNVAYGYISVGFVMENIFLRKSNDKAGIGLSQLYYQDVHQTNVTKQIDNALEVYYKLDINRYISLKPTFFGIITRHNPITTGALLNFSTTIPY